MSRLKQNIRRRSHRSLVHLVIFAMFGAMMFCSTLIMEGLPNIHPLAMFIIVLTVVYRGKALIPLYIYIILSGLRWGFGLAWVPYLYVWLPLWGAVMLLPRSLSVKWRAAVYPAVAVLHGLLFGVLYAPAQALLFGLNFEQTLSWVAMGFAFDITHAVGNGVIGLLALPMSELLQKLERKI